MELVEALRSRSRGDQIVVERPDDEVELSVNGVDYQTIDGEPHVHLEGTSDDHTLWDVKVRPGKAVAYYETTERVDGDLEVTRNNEASVEGIRVKE